MSTFSLSVGKSVALHIVLGSLLLVSMDFHTPPAQPTMSSGKPIQAVAVDESAVQEQIKRIKDQEDAKRRAEEKRIADLEKRAAEAEKRRKREESKVSELERQKKRKLEEKKKADQAAADAKQKQDQEKARAKKLEDERKRKEAEKKKAEELAKKAEEKRKREEQALREAERKRQQQLEEEAQARVLQEQMEAERAEQAARRGQQIAGEVQKYIALVSNTIERNWLVDDSMNGTSCRLNIQLASNGLVLKVRVLEGSPNICRAAERAVLKAVTLPVSKDPEVFKEFKNFNITMSR